MEKIIGNIVNKITNFISSLSKTQRIFALLIAVVILMFLVNLLSNVSFKKTEIDYKNVTGATLIEGKVASSDRDLYATLDKIVTNFLKSKIEKYTIDGKTIKIKDYYENTLYTEYKYNRSLGKFKKNVNTFYSKIFTDKSVKYQEIPLEKVIKNIYEYSPERGMYIVELNTNSGVPAYIGIELDSISKVYSIFYLE